MTSLSSANTGEIAQSDNRNFTRAKFELEIILKYRLAGQDRPISTGRGRGEGKGEEGRKFKIPIKYNKGLQRPDLTWNYTNLELPSEVYLALLTK